jgi:alkylhydroperoxidase/carboxymuconolactone decarboxylase family protein YurZ
MDAVENYVVASLKSGAISPKLRELVWLAVDALVTHLYPSGLELHIRGALREGATPWEVLEALQIASAASNRAYRPAAAIVHEEALAAGAGGDAPVIWPAPATDIALRLTPEYVAALAAMDDLPAGETPMAPRERELVALALCGSPALADMDGVRRHARRALELGADQAELLGALQLTGGIGLHAFSLGVPILAQVLDGDSEGEGRGGTA